MGRNASTRLENARFAWNRLEDMDIIDLETMTWMQPNLSGTLPQARNAHTMTAPRLLKL